MKPFNQFDAIIMLENGELNEEEVIEAMQMLLDTGLICHLQGSYQRLAVQMIEAGHLTTRQPKS
jgi:hypothetical protein